MKVSGSTGLIFLLSKKENLKLPGWSYFFDAGAATGNSGPRPRVRYFTVICIGVTNAESRLLYPGYSGFSQRHG